MLTNTLPYYWKITNYNFYKFYGVGSGAPQFFVFQNQLSIFKNQFIIFVTNIALNKLRMFFLILFFSYRSNRRPIQQPRASDKQIRSWFRNSSCWRTVSASTWSRCTCSSSQSSGTRRGGVTSDSASPASCSFSLASIRLKIKWSWTLVLLRGLKIFSPGVDKF